MLPDSGPGGDARPPLGPLLRPALGTDPFCNPGGRSIPPGPLRALLLYPGLRGAPLLISYPVCIPLPRARPFLHRGSGGALLNFEPLGDPHFLTSQRTSALPQTPGGSTFPSRDHPVSRSRGAFSVLNPCRPHGSVRVEPPASGARVSVCSLEQRERGALAQGLHGSWGPHFSQGCGRGRGPSIHCLPSLRRATARSRSWWREMVSVLRLARAAGEGPEASFSLGLTLSPSAL